MSTPITDIIGIGPSIATALSEHGFNTIEDLASTTTEALCVVPGFGPVKAETVITQAALLAIPDKPAKKKKKTKPKNKVKVKSKKKAKKDPKPQKKDDKKKKSKKSENKKKAKAKSKKSDKKKKKK